MRVLSGSKGLCGFAGIDCSAHWHINLTGVVGVEGGLRVLGRSESLSNVFHCGAFGIIKVGYIGVECKLLLFN